MITPGPDGKITCPQCQRRYVPVLKRPAGDTRSLQKIFPRSKAIEREQLISGIGCDACWDLFLTGTTTKTCTC